MTGKAHSIRISISGSALALMILSSIVWGQAASAQTMLQGGIEVNQSCHTEQFQKLVESDRNVACWIKPRMDRLFQVSHDDRMRLIVWKRMQKEELQLASRQELSRIEELADECGLPLKERKS